ncbi:MAG: beta-galactosidase [Armatimonadota bacterium]|nr:beta-galactosidase [Armatimonadota bacterium]
MCKPLLFARIIGIHIVCIPLIALPSSARAAQANLLGNPGFESLEKGFPLGWGAFEDKARGMAAADREEVFDGKYALKLMGDPSEAWEPIFSDLIPADNGGEYTIACYCKSALSKGDVLFALREIASDGRTVTFHKLPIPKSSDWAFYSVTVKLSDKATSVQVFIVLPNCGGEAWFDDVMLVKGELGNIASLKSRTKTSSNSSVPKADKKGNILLNNGFEFAVEGQTLPLHWAFVAEDKSCIVGIAHDRRFSDSAAATQYHARGGLPGSYLVTETPLDVWPNVNYRLSGWVMTSATGKSDWTSVPYARGKRVEGCCLQLVFRGETGNIIDDVWSQALQTGGKWKRVEVSGKAPADAYTVEVRLFHGDFKGRSWFDSVRLEPLGDTSDSVPEWRLYKDVYSSGQLPPTFRVIKKSGLLKAGLQDDGKSDEYCVTIQPSDSGKFAEADVVWPEVDTSWPGAFRISGEYCFSGHGASASANVSVGSYDIDDKALSRKVVRLARSATWTRFSIDYVAGALSEHASVEANVAGKGCTLRIRGLRAERKSRIDLEQYVGAPGNAKSATSVRQPAQAADARIINVNGVPTLTVNGKAISLDQYINTYRPFDSVAGNCAQAGLIQVVSLFDIDWEKGPTAIDFEDLDSQIYQILRAAPGAYVMICPDSTGEHGAKSWSYYNPTERYVNDLGLERIKSYGGEFKTYPSMASRKWRQDMEAMLTCLVEHVRQSGYADRVIGYMLSGYEWFQWEWSDHDRMDYSAHVRDAFRRWLSERYGTVENLLSAWRNQTVTFDLAEIPSTERRRKTIDGVFRDPAAGQDVIDFCRFYSDLAADLLIGQGKAVKSASAKSALTCAMYGYIPLFFDGICRETTGHFGVAKALESGYFDFNVAPSDGYMFERAIGGTGGYITVPGASTLRNSIYVTQADFRTHWSRQDIERTDTTRDDINIIRREFALNLTNLCATQWYDFSTGWLLGDKRITNDLAKLKKVGEFARKLNRKISGEGIAVIISDDANCYIGTDRAMFDSNLIYHQRPLLFRSGMPHRYYLMSDLANPNMPDYRFYLFPNAFKLTSKEKAMIGSKCMRSGSVVMFVYAPGYIDEQSVSAENITRFLGINIEKAEGVANSGALIDADSSCPWLKNSPGIVYGKCAWPLIFRVNDKTATALGDYIGTDVAGLAYKDFGDYKVVYSGSPLLPPALLRDVGRLAGCNIYLETNDAVYADNDFVAIHTKADGVKTIRLPRKADVYDLLHRRVLAKGVNSFKVRMNSNETGLFYVGDAGKAESAFSANPQKRSDPKSQRKTSRR